jgi:hypothetical protein
MKILDGRAEFFQWDVNQKLTSPDLAEGDEVHFYNVTLPKALVVEAYELDGAVVADVPNILLQKPLEIKVYRYVTENDSSATRADFSFPVRRRAKPEDYVYTETELVRVEDYVKKALEKAKASGEFKGDKGDKGDPYKLTETDKTEIVDAVLSALPDNREVAY